MFGKEGIWPFIPFHPALKGRQHTLCPSTRFDPVLSTLGLSGLLSPFGHSLRVCVLVFEHPVSTSLRPFAPRALPRLNATMDALTPAGSALRLLSSEREHRPNCPTGLPASRARPLRPFHPQPPNCPRRRFCTRPLSTTGVRCVPHRIRLRGFLALSPVSQAESGSLPLWTGLSPPVALHPASRRRSYSRLQAGACMPEEDFHLPVRARLQAH